MSTEQNYTFRVTITFDLELKASSPRAAEGIIDGKVDGLLHGSYLSVLVGNTGDYETEMVKNGLEEELEQNLEYVHNNQPFCIQGDADRYHLDCAKEVYRWRAVKALICRDKGIGDLDKRYPQDNEGNTLYVIYGHEWAQDARNAMVHGETIYDSCGACLNNLYDEPKKEERE